MWRRSWLSREVLAVNLVMAGCKPEYAPVVRAALLALTQPAFNLNGVQATTHMAAPLLVVNGPLAASLSIPIIYVAMLIVSRLGAFWAFGEGFNAQQLVALGLMLAGILLMRPA
jgi:lysylphosphatidylglycerol synthetase-like protein (DUF2156 family)